MIRYLKKLFSVAAALAVCGSAFAKGITVSIGAGTNWKEKREPQVAVWLENADGNYIRTLYVTSRAEKRSWIFSPKDGRPESLPVWYCASGENPAKGGGEKTALDAVSSATPKGGVIFDAEIDGEKSYVLKAELNNSFDYNGFYTKKNSGVNGQPSVVYGEIIPAGFTQEIRLELLGTGSLDGSDGIIHAETENLTTAQHIVSCIAVVSAAD
ncbi:MAG: DUF2271 domain-containing protein [Treponema porcinum]|uniref:DUF2271 domain-containing protein n=1 Tax=Treponema porcinum TaxID=261392 RepID=UPI002352E4B5|nr:DUF2271 domain-containing protein [Treponema porcinum]MCI6179461.1 DUF2271 domain-containing protein [Treponema porcinum]